jgi:hypothetical protein
MNLRFKNTIDGKYFLHIKCIFSRYFGRSELKRYKHLPYCFSDNFNPIRLIILYSSVQFAHRKYSNKVYVTWLISNVSVEKIFSYKFQLK